MAAANTPDLNPAFGRGPLYVLATVMWEYFSYYGMRALLILYLTQSLLFTDKNAYALYGAYTSLIYVTPIIGGWVADKFLGYRYSTILGAALIISGHIALFFPGMNHLYLGLTLLVFGVGFFKTNSVCLIGDFYKKNPEAKSSAFAMYYVGGNIGGTLAPIVCACVANAWGWHYGFAAAGVGMAVGLLIMLSGYKHLQNKGNPVWKKGDENNWQKWSLLGVGFALGLIVINVILRDLLVGWLLLGIGIFAMIYSWSIYKSSNNKAKLHLRLIFILMIFGVLFWAFDQQLGSSINIFIERNVNRGVGFSFGAFHWHSIIPGPVFQSINPAIVIIAGIFIAWLWRALAKAHKSPKAATKVLFGMVFITIGFMFIAFGAHFAAATGKSSMFWVVPGLMLIGVSEMFIDPVLLAVINKEAPKKHLSVLTGIYYFFTGAFANYVAAKIAILAADHQDFAHGINLMKSAHLFSNMYFKLVAIGIVMAVLLIIFRSGFKRLAVVGD